MGYKPKFVRFGDGGEEWRPSDDGDLRAPPASKSLRIEDRRRKKNANENGFTPPARREK